MDRQHKTLLEKSEERVLPFYELRLQLAEKEINKAKEMLLAHLDNNSRRLFYAFIDKCADIDLIKRDMHIQIGLTMASLLK